LGKIPILTNIFQMGWNHQLVFLAVPTCSGILLATPLGGHRHCARATLSLWKEFSCQVSCVLRRRWEWKAWKVKVFDWQSVFGFISLGNIFESESHLSMESRLKQHWTLCFFSRREKNICFLYIKRPRFGSSSLLCCFLSVKFCPSNLLVSLPLSLGSFFWPKKRRSQPSFVATWWRVGPPKVVRETQRWRWGGWRVPRTHPWEWYIFTWYGWWISMGSVGILHYITIHGWDGVYNFLSSWIAISHDLKPPKKVRKSKGNGTPDFQENL